MGLDTVYVCRMLSQRTYRFRGSFYSSLCQHLLLHIVWKCVCVCFSLNNEKLFLRNDKMAWRRCSKIYMYTTYARTCNQYHQHWSKGKRKANVREEKKERDVWQKTSTEITRAIKYLIQLLVLAHRTSQITRWNFNAAAAKTHSSERASIWYYGISNIFTFIMRLFPIHIQYTLAHTIYIFLLLLHSFLPCHRRHRWSLSHFHSIPFQEISFSAFSFAKFQLPYYREHTRKMVSRKMKSERKWNAEETHRMVRKRGRFWCTYKTPSFFN